MPEPGADTGPPAPAPPEGGWMRDYAETIARPEPPVEDSGPVTLLEMMQMQSDTGVAQAQTQLGRAESGLAGPVGGGLSGGFLVDPERAEAAVLKMEQVVIDLRREQANWRRSSFFPPPAADEVSINLARNGALMAERADAYLTEYVRQIDETVSALRAQLEAYRRVDRTNASRA